jgi:hypothetical protein
MTLSGADVVGQLLVVLREAVEGPPGPWTHFIDNKPGAGLLGALEPLSAAEASRPWGGSSIAAHVHHLAFALDVSAASLAGDNAHRDWNQSWTVSSVDDAAWKTLLARFRAEYANLILAVESHATTDEAALGAAIGVIAHVAYHLGAVRQKLASAKNP